MVWAYLNIRHWDVNMTEIGYKNMVILPVLMLILCITKGLTSNSTGIALYCRDNSNSSILLQLVYNETAYSNSDFVVIYRHIRRSGWKVVNPPEEESNDNETLHTVDVTPLRPNTLYYFTLWTDRREAAAAVCFTRRNTESNADYAYVYIAILGGGSVVIISLHLGYLGLIIAFLRREIQVVHVSDNPRNDDCQTEIFEPLAREMELPQNTSQAGDDKEIEHAENDVFETALDTESSGDTEIIQNTSETAEERETVRKNNDESSSIPLVIIREEVVIF